MNARLLEFLRCPVERARVQRQGDHLVCPEGHRYPIVEGVPMLLRADVGQTFWVAGASMQSAPSANDPWRLETLGLGVEERGRLKTSIANGASRIDPVANFMVAETSGHLYQHLVGRLDSYPIPGLAIPAGEGRRFLDVGCSWGRWSVAAAWKGFRVIGIDPSLGATLAAARVARQLGVEADFIVADARYLPLADESIDFAYSYSVLQHFEKADAGRALGEMGRVLRPDGCSLVQMPNAFGVRALTHILGRGPRRPRNFEVRYWTLPELRRTFERQIGTATITAHAYGGLGVEISDLRYLSPLGRWVARMSAFLVKLASLLPFLKYLADSVYVKCRKARGDRLHHA